MNWEEMRTYFNLDDSGLERELKACEQYQLWQSRRDPLARIREGTPDNPRRIEGAEQ